MSEDRRTKAQLLREIERVQGELENIQVQNAKLQQLVVKPAAVPEAEALAGCIRALDPIADKRHSSSYGNSVLASNPEIEHVIRHLMGRYKLNLVERLLEPCSRSHLDDATESQVVERLRFGGVIR